jgi:hypothetical protein
MPQGIGYDPQLLAALAALQKATGIGAAPEVHQPSILDALTKATGIRGVAPQVDPPTSLPENMVQDFITRMGMNTPPPIRDPRDTMERVLPKATGIGAGEPDMMTRMRNAMSAVLGSFSKPEAVAGPTSRVGDIALPSEPMAQGPMETPRRRVAADVSKESGNSIMRGAGDTNNGIMERFKEEIGGLFGLEDSELPAARVPGAVESGMGGVPSLPVGGQPVMSGGGGHPLLSGFATSIMSGIMESIVPAVVSFAANRTNSPEIVQAWSTQEAMKLSRAENAMRNEIAQMQMVGDLLSAERAEEQLELSRLNLQRGLAQDVRGLQNEVAPNDPLTYIKSIQGMSNLWTGSGGDLDVFLDMSKLPNAPLLDRLRDDFFKAHAATALDPAAQSAASVRNPWAPDDPTQNFTLDEAAVILGHVSKEGRILQPLGAIRPADIVERVTRDAAGVERTTREPISTAMGKTDTKQPSAGESTLSFVGTDPDTEEPIINIINRRVGQTRLKGQRTPQFVDPLGKFMRDTMRDTLGGPDSLEEAKAWLRTNGIANPTDAEAQELLDRSK